MTRRQSEIFDFVKEFIREKGFAPTLREIGEEFGLTSLATVHKHLQCLKAQGHITVSPTKKQSIQIVTKPAAKNRFEFEGPHHLWDNVLNCYWVRQKDGTNG